MGIVDPGAAISYAASKLWAIPVALVALAVAAGMVYFTQWAISKRTPAENGSTQKRSRLSILMGADGRLSTSRAVAAAWTAVVLYILVTLLFAWPSHWSKALKNLSPTYLLLLGGPYASLVLSKGIVNGRLNAGSLQKTNGDGVARLSDLVSDDSGSTDLFDVQYVIFNLVAIAYVIDAFVRASLGSGFPSIPEGLVLLTGGPAAVYLVNKAVSSNPPVISTVTPSAAFPSATFQIVGQNLVPDVIPGVGGAAPGPTTSKPQVEVGGQVAEVDGFTTDRITARVPVPVTAIGGAVSVGVITSANQRCDLAAALTILPPVVLGIDKSSVSQGDWLTVTGRWASTDKTKPTAIIGGVTVPDYKEPIGGMTIQFIVPPLGGGPRSVDVWLVLGTQSSQHMPVHFNG